MKRGIQFTCYIGDIGQRCDVQYIFLKFNQYFSSHPQFMKKIQKSLYGTVRFTVPKTLTIALHPQEISSVTVTKEVVLSSREKLGLTFNINLYQFSGEMSHKAHV
uniref:Uncharacterized protein n=1 Tax=Timema cristinae TaxID=61476 RepID=A0A7R9CHR1_TIMCR|nr:unnamed protein product [Timema cristinae]